MPFLLYLFPVDAIQNNYNELGSLTEQKFILSQFWKPEVWSQCQWAKSKCQRLLLLEALQENPFFASLSFCWLPTFLGLASITPVSASAVTSPPSVSVWKLPLIPLIRIHTTTLRDHPDNSGEEDVDILKSAPKGLRNFRSALPICVSWELVWTSKNLDYKLVRKTSTCVVFQV